MSSESLSGSEIDAKLRELDKKLDELRRDYEQFFVGSRDRPPKHERRTVERLVRELEQAQISNTSQQFRLRSLIQRFSSYRQKWNRTQRQIEEGTYRPHQQRAEERVGEEDREPETETGSDSEADRDGDDEPVVELDEDFGEIDLEGLEHELDEMDDAGEFEEYGDGPRASEAEQQRERASADSNRPSSSARERTAAGSEGADEPEKREKIREMQEKLGISSGGDDSSRSRESRASGARSSAGERGESASSESTSSSDLPTGGADRNDLEKMRQNLRESENQSRRDSAQSRKRSGDSTGRTRESQREQTSNRRRANRHSSDDEGSSSDDDEETHAEGIFRRLVTAKRERGEATDHLTPEAVLRSMDRQRRQLSDDHAPEKIRFEVVVKDGGVFLQPQLPD